MSAPCPSCRGYGRWYTGSVGLDVICAACGGSGADPNGGGHTTVVPPPDEVPVDRPRGRVEVLVTEHETRATELGPALWITIERRDGRRMSWAEVHDVYTDAYPGRWAVHVHPPVERTHSTACRYHLWVLDHEPRGLDVAAP